MSNLLGFWPIKSFITYVLKRSLGKFLKNKIDFNKYDLTQKKITFRDLELNTQMINENMKDSPFKVMHVGIGSVQINNPSLNFITSKISIEISNVEVIIMPYLIVNEKNIKRNLSFDSDAEKNNDQNQKQAEDVTQKSEEYNILNNLFNKILSNLEAKITTISVKVMTREFNMDDPSEIPTFMLRLTNIEYKRSSVLDSDTRPVSDWQVILDGKTLDIGELSMHLLPTYQMSHEQEKQKANATLQQQQSVKLKHPSEYPQINHPSTFLVIKPSVHQQILFKDQKFQGMNSSCIATTGSLAAISLSMSFPCDLKANKLQLKVHIPNIESISSYDQLKAMIQFGKELDLYVDQRQGKVPLPNKDYSKKDIDVRTLEMMSQKMMHDKVSQKELEKLKKLIEEEEKHQKSPKSDEKQQKKDLKKKEKSNNMLIKYIKFTQKKSEFEKLKDDLQKSVMQQDDLTKTQILNQSVVQESARKQPLSIVAFFQLNKASVIFNLNDSACHTQYDKIYDSIQHPQLNPLNQSVNQQSQVKQQTAIFNTVQEDSHQLLREDQRVGYSHYNLEGRELKVEVNIQQVKRSSKDQMYKTSKYMKRIDIFTQLKNLQLNRYDLCEKQRPQSQIKKTQQDQVSQESKNISLDQSSAQYESFYSSSGMFKSAQEFYMLDQSVVNQSSQYQRSLEKSLHKRHSNNGGQSQIHKSSQHQSPQALNKDQSYQNFQQQPIIFGNIFNLKSQQHFCHESVISFKKLRGVEDDLVSDMKLRISQENIDSFKMIGDLKIGSLSINFGFPELIFISQLMQDVGGDSVKKVQTQSDKKLKLDSLCILLDDIQLDLFRNLKLQKKLNQIIGLLIQHSPIQDLISFQRKCYCDIKQPGVLLRLQMCNIQMKAKTNHLKLNLLQVNLLNIYGNQKTLLNQVTKVNLDINFGKIVKEDEGFGVQKSEVANQNSQGAQQTFSYFENDEIEIISDEEDEQKTDSQTQQQSNDNLFNTISALQQKTQTTLRIQIQQSQSVFYSEDLSTYVIPMIVKLEEILKYFFISSDLAKCWSFEKSYETLAKVEYFKQNKIQGQQLRLNLVVQIENAQICVNSRERQIEGKKISKNNCKKLFKIRAQDCEFKVDINNDQKQEKFQINFGVQDILVLDFLQTLPTYHPSVLTRDIRTETSLDRQNLDRFYAPENSTFIEELEQSAPFVLLYKQQGLAGIKAISLEAEIIFKIEKQFKDIVSTELIATLFGKALERGHINMILQVCEEVNFIKRNPMIANLNATFTGLIARLTLNSDLIMKMLLITDDVQKCFEKLRQKPVIEVNLNKKQQEENIPKTLLQKQTDKSDIKLENLQQDQVKAIVKLQQITIDYDPLLKFGNYEKVFNDDVLSYDFKKLEENMNKNLRTMIRAVLQIQSIEISYEKSKERLSNQLEISNIGLSIVKQNTIAPSMNPLLLLDFSKEINSQGDISLLDYLGFLQIMSLDLVKLKYNKKKNITIMLSQQNQETTNLSQDQKDYLADIQQELQEKQLISLQEELYETSYGMTTLVNKNPNFQSQLSNIKKIYQKQFQSPVQEAKGTLINELIELQHQESNSINNKEIFQYNDQPHQKQYTQEFQQLLRQESTQSNNLQFDQNNTTELNQIEQNINFDKEISPQKFEQQVINQIQEKQQKLKVFAHKLIAYMAQDSYQTMKYLIKSMGLQFSEMQMKLQKVQEMAGGKQSKSSNKNKLTRKQVLAKSIFQEDEESLRKILNEFLDLAVEGKQDDEGLIFSMSDGSNNKSQVLSNSCFQENLKPVDPDDPNESAFYYQPNNVDDQGYFQINSGVRSDKNDIGIQGIQIDQYINRQDRFQELTEKELNPFSYKKCHELPKRLKELFSQMKISIELKHVDVKLYQGQDFDFEMLDSYPEFLTNATDNNYNSILGQSLLSTSYMAQRDENKMQTQICNSIINIQNDYLDHKTKVQAKIQQSQTTNTLNNSQNIRESQLSVSLRMSKAENQKQSQKPKKRKRITNRSFYLNFQIVGTQFTHNVLKDYKDLVNYRTDFTHYVFSVNKLQNQFKYENQLELMMKYNIGEESDLIGIKAKFQPFKLLLNQGTVLFIQKYFDLDFTPQSKDTSSSSTTYGQHTYSYQNSQNNNQSAISGTSSQRHKPVYIDQLKIQTFSATFCYTSHNLNLYDLRNGNIIELLNFFNINDLKLLIKPYELQQKLKREEALRHMLKFYKEDLIQNQKINFVKAIGPIRSVFNISGALYGVIKKPYQAYQNEKGVLKGLGEGFYDLYSVMTEESYNFTNKIRDGVVKVKKAAEKHL
eukprot:403357015